MNLSLILPIKYELLHHQIIKNIFVCFEKEIGAILIFIYKMKLDLRIWFAYTSD